MPQVYLLILQLALLFIIPIYIAVVWALTLPTYIRHMTQPEFSSQRSAELIRFLFSPVTVGISILSYILTPVLAVLGLILFALAGVIIWPFSLLLRYLPRFIRELIAKLGALGEKILQLDTVLIANFFQRLRDLMRALLGTVGSFIISFPFLINWGMRRLKHSTYVRERALRDIRRFERLLRADIAADLLIAIAIDPRYHKDSRIEAVRLLRELERPVDDLLHIIAVPAIDHEIAIEAADQAVQGGTEQVGEWEARAIRVWEELARHPHPEAILRAAERLSTLGKAKDALGLLRTLVGSRGIPAVFRARAAGQLYETNVDAVEDETPAQVMNEAEQDLEQMTKSSKPSDRLEGAAGLIRLKSQPEGQPKQIRIILDLLDDANLVAPLRQRALQLLAELGLVAELRFAVTKPAPTPEQQWPHRMEAIGALEKVLPAEAVQQWAALAAEPALSPEDARHAMSAIRRLCSEPPPEAGWTQADINSPEVQEGITRLRELGSNKNVSAALRMEAADTLEALDQVKDANSIYYLLQTDPTVDKPLQDKAARAVRRLERALLANRPGRAATPDN